MPLLKRGPFSGAAVVGLLLTLVAVDAAPLEAQTVRGRLLESGRETPVGSGMVVLLTETNAVIDRTVTDEEGRFVLRAPDPGSYFIRAEALGYRSKTDGILELGEGGEITIAFYLRPEPLEMEGIRATGERDLIELGRRRFLEGQGFYERLERGFGEFVTPEEIERRRPVDAEDLFRSIQAVSVRTLGGGGAANNAPPGSPASGRQPVFGEVLMMRSGNPTVYIDGILVWPPPTAVQGGCRTDRPALSPGGGGGGSAWPFPIEDHVSIADIQAVEVFSGPSETPMEYNTTGASCGVILIWTG